MVYSSLDINCLDYISKLAKSENWRRNQNPALKESCNHFRGVKKIGMLIPKYWDLTLQWHGFEMRS